MSVSPGWPADRPAQQPPVAECATAQHRV